ncbi:MAG: hypothetical protein HYS12_08435 [Planctomycetes bacterium]|nr:hypothetical protein [Planctomycetota bacterium]
MRDDRIDPLSAPVNDLQQVLTQGFPGRERDWAERVAAGLGAVEAALRQHAGQSETPDGVFAAVDLQRPTFLRQMNGLRLGLTDLLREVRDLSERVRQAGRAFTTAAPRGHLDQLPAPVARAAVPHFGELRAEVEDFLGRLRQHREEETRLVLESVTTDIGAGD